MTKSLIIRGESMEDYHDNTCASSSKIKAFNESGAFFFHERFIAKTIPKDEPTEALILGCCFDTLMTESMEAFGQKYVIKPEGMSFSTTVGKAWKADHATNGQKVIPHNDWLMMDAMRQSIQAHPLFPVLIHPQTLPQVTVRKTVTQYGVGLQSRPDWLSPIRCELSDGRPYSVNLKTTLDWSLWFDESDPDGPRQGQPVYTHGYHRQAALDQWCLFQSPDIRETAHFLLVVEKCQPYRVGVVQLTEEYLECGWNETEHDLLRIAECVRTNRWPKNQDGVVRIRPPKWLLDKAERKAVSA